MKTLILTYPHLSKTEALVYRVSQVEQDTTYKPGQALCEAEVKDLCQMTGKWKIVVKHNKDTR